MITYILINTGAPKDITEWSFSLLRISENQFLKYVIVQMLQCLRIEVKGSKVIGSSMLEL